MTPPTRSPSPDDGLKGLPGGGIYPIEFSPAFLASIGASQDGHNTGDIYGMNYINKPGTITDNSFGEITKKQGEDTVAGFPHEKGMTMLDVKEEDQEREFVMVWNEDRASFTIYPVMTTLTLSQNVPLSEKNSPKSETGELPSVKGKSTTKSKQSRAKPPSKPKATAARKKAETSIITKGRAITKIKSHTTGQDGDKTHPVGQDRDVEPTKRDSGNKQKSKETSSPPWTVPTQNTNTTARKTLPVLSGATLKSSAIIDDSDDSMAEQEDEDEEEDEEAEEEEDDFAALLSAEMANPVDTDIEMNDSHEPIVIVDDSTESEEDDDGIW